ncbi:restriction endonuclease subunit S [Vibrio sp. 10N.222.49.C9]|uniref:restriction endonuclease subunit S n=1 Tax=Vibrio sp. 10N.222.49.C9 TaxID=3229615 RepID=UPI00354C91B7
MGSKWEQALLGELIAAGDAVLQTGPFGTALKAEEYTETGVPLISVREIREGFIQLEDITPRVDSAVTARLPKFVLQEGDIVFARKGGVERNALITEREKGWFVGSDGIYLRLSKKYDAKYFSYVMRSPQVKAWLLKNCEGTTMPSLNQKILARVPIFLPSKIQQEKIADLLFQYDEKITINNQINQTLEKMAQTLFKSWFVDFDPVKAKMNGEQPKGMDTATASLFPEKLVESELGLIPEGWSVESAKSQLDVLRGFSYKGKGLVASLDEGVPMHNLNSVLEGGGYKYKGLKFYSDEFKDKFLVQEGDVLVANTEQGHNHLLIGYGAMIPKHLAFGFCSHHTYRVRPKSDSNVTPEFIERLFGKGRFVKQVQGFTNGTTVNMLPIAGMEMPEFVVPPRTLAKKYSELVKPMKAMIEENHKSNIELAKLRDTLLPKLLSGEIDLESVQVEQVKELAE